MLRAGLAKAAWVTVDDTGARHKAQNGTCTHIGNDRFAWFGTTGSKSRLNFLDLLRTGHSDYVINPAALAYMRSRSLAARSSASWPSLRPSISPIGRPGRPISTSSASQHSRSRRIPR